MMSAFIQVPNKNHKLIIIQFILIFLGIFVTSTKSEHIKISLYKNEGSQSRQDFNC
jgi:uncharacterized membrane protein